MSWIQQKEATTLEKKSSILKELNRQNFNTLTIYLSQFVAGNKFKSVDKPTRFSNTRQNVWYYQIFTGHFKIDQTSCIIATFEVPIHSFCEISTYCLNKPYIIFFYIFFIPSTAKGLIKHMRWRVPT